MHPCPDVFSSAGNPNKTTANTTKRHGISHEQLYNSQFQGYLCPELTFADQLRK
jgi:hypothetical protein